MGKVYEATEKAGREKQQPVWRAVRGVNDRNDRNDRADSPLKSRKDDFSFMQYSLNAAGEAGKDAEGAVAYAMAQSSKEVGIDVSRLDPHLVSFYDFDPRSSQQYRNLAIKVIAAAEEQPFKRVLVTSAQHREGRTCVSLNLACALAAAGKRTLIIDGDFNRPSALRMLGIESEVGLEEMLRRGLPVSAASLKVMPYGIDLLPTRSRVENPAELLSSAALRDMLYSLDPDYDFILFDSPPLTSAASSLLVRLVDRAVLVVQAGKTNSAQMARALTPLNRESILGVVINRGDKAVTGLAE